MSFDSVNQSSCCACMRWIFWVFVSVEWYKIHRHGVRQLRSGWSDGPSYITQCPIQSGQSYVYNFSLVGQRGTLFWHAHHSWLRATLYGPLIILPRTNESYPFAKPYKEIPIIFGTSTHACIYIYNIIKHSNSSQTILLFYISILAVYM